MNGAAADLTRMNYRHAFHAGNFADVLKHVVLTLVLEHMKLKPAPFRVVDTHAGIGLYDLAGPEAEKTGEWREGIGRLLAQDAPAALRPLLAPYLDAVRAVNRGGCLLLYPGSPRLARSLLRRCDRLVLNELHPEDFDRLREGFVGDPQTKVLRLDAWTALKALLPPKERRGVVLIDPPFEEPGEFERIASGLREARRRFATGIYLAWFPIKELRAAAAFYRRLEALVSAPLLRIELFVREPRNPEVLNGCGLVVLNPPFTLAERLEQLLPYLVQLLGQGSGAGHRLDWILPAAAESRTSR